MKTMFFIVLFGSLILGLISTMDSKISPHTPGTWLLRSTFFFIVFGLPILLISFIVSSML